MGGGPWCPGILAQICISSSIWAPGISFWRNIKSASSKWAWLSKGCHCDFPSLGSWVAAGASPEWLGKSSPFESTGVPSSSNNKPWLLVQIISGKNTHHLEQDIWCNIPPHKAQYSHPQCHPQLYIVDVMEDEIVCACACAQHYSDESVLHEK